MARNKEEFDHLVEVFEGKLKKAQERLDKYRHDLQDAKSDVMYVMYWSDSAIHAAATIQVYKQILQGLAFNPDQPDRDWQERLHHVTNYTIERVLQKASNITSQSTNPMATYTDRSETVAWARAAEYLWTMKQHGVVL